MVLCCSIHAQQFMTVSRFNSANEFTLFTDELVQSSMPSTGNTLFAFAYCTMPYWGIDDECWLAYDGESRQFIAKPNKSEAQSPWRLAVDGPVVDSLAQLTTLVVNLAGRESRWGYDGTHYLLVSSEGRSANTWAPEKGTTLRQLMLLYRKVCKAVKASSKEQLEALMPETVSMLATYRKLARSHARR